MEIKALGEFVVMTAKAKSAGSETKSAGGLILAPLETGEVPEVCFVHAIGEKVPEGYLKIGDMTPIPAGHIKNIPHPDVAQKHKTAKEIEQKFFSVHYTHIPAVYSAAE